MKWSTSIGIIRNYQVTGFLTILVLGFAHSASSQQSDTQFIKLLSQPITVSEGKDFRSDVLDEIIDVVYLIKGRTGLPTTRRFSAVYSDLLYNKSFFVGRPNYPQEEAELAAAGKTIFDNWEREKHRKGLSTWRAPSFAEGLGACVTKAGSEQIKYFSTIRLYDVVIDFDCLYRNLPSGIDPVVLQWFLRETEHSNALIIHGAQELFLSSFIEQRRHSYEVVSTRNFQFKPASDLLDITYVELSISRKWLDETFWSFSKTGASLFLRNEYSFNSGGDQLRAGDLCFVRDISLMCRANGSARVCRVENARCERISRDIAN